MTTFIQPLTSETVTVSNIPIGITARPGAAGRLAYGAVLAVETAAVRYWEGGSTPSSTDGILVAAGGVIELVGRTSVNLFRAVRATGSDAVLRVQPYAEFQV